MKRFFAFLFCAAVFVLNGCSKDGDEGNSERLFGKWLLVSEYDEWINDQGKIEGEYDPYMFEESFYIEFRSDGTGTICDTVGMLDSEEFTYQFDSSSRMIYWLSGGLSEEPPYIEKLTSSKLVMTWFYDEAGLQLSEKAIFRRVN